MLYGAISDPESIVSDNTPPESIESEQPRDEASPRPRALHEPFRVVAEVEGTTATVAPIGELDLATVDQVDNALKEAANRRTAELELDLRGVTFMDSSGIHLLISWNESMQESSTVFRVIQGSPEIRRLFEVTDLIDDLPFVDRPSAGHVA
jgi:anti-sigma B factor antagonist